MRPWIVMRRLVAQARRCTPGRTGWRRGQCWGWRVHHSWVARPARRQPSRRRLQAHPRWHPQRLADKVRERRLHLRRQTHQPRQCCPCCHCCHRARHRRRHHRTYTAAEASSAAGLRSRSLELIHHRLPASWPIKGCPNNKKGRTDLFICNKSVSQSVFSRQLSEGGGCFTVPPRAHPSSWPIILLRGGDVSARAHTCVAWGRCVAFGRPNMSVWGHAGARSRTPKVACISSFRPFFGTLFSIPFWLFQFSVSISLRRPNSLEET